MGIVLAGGVHYLRTLQESLRDNAAQGVINATSRKESSNIFDALADSHSAWEDIRALITALQTQGTTSIIFDSDNGKFIYTYTLLESVEDWGLLSIVPMDATSAETDEILQYSQTSLLILMGILLICVMFPRCSNIPSHNPPQPFHALSGTMIHSYAGYVGNSTFFGHGPRFL